jgi:hypothetical protein
MTKYYIKKDNNNPSKYLYCTGSDTDGMWNPDTCIEVLPQPSVNYVYNFEKSEWELDRDKYMADLRAKRNQELNRVDKYVLSDFPISAEDKLIVLQYRQDLRDCPDKEVFEERVLPECPDICKG